MGVAGKRHADTSGTTSTRQSTVDNNESLSKQDHPASTRARPLAESPLKRVKRAVDRMANKRVIDNADELRTFILDKDPTGRMVEAAAAGCIALHMRVAWTSFDTCSTGAVARLHLIDRDVKESVEEIHKIVKDDYESMKSVVDAELVTASMYGVDANTPGLPKDGVTILVSRMWSLKLFNKTACQLSTSIDSIRVDAW